MIHAQYHAQAFRINRRIATTRLAAVICASLIVAGLTGCGSSAAQSGEDPNAGSSSLVAMTAPRTQDACKIRASTDGTGIGGGHYSRARFYDSIDALADDSDLIIIGTVLGSSTDRADDMLLGTTSHDVAVYDAIKGDVSIGDVITVRQAGSPDDAATPGIGRYSTAETIMCVGDTRLLFLQRFELSDEALASYPTQVYLQEPVTELPTAYYVTGMIVGIYTPDGTDAADTADAPTRFTRSFPDTLDELPDRIRLITEPADRDGEPAATQDGIHPHQIFTRRFASE
ncbi:hypothetical protein [Bifidobacterium simiiventris]|uniref:hypothetical protein n=1 Tax=Bifidobacterium simiiventris TaxID=2834434 RepID=UPI001C57E000|nr:hypothetical protein [Bifidobacterium simiiventris]MBW3079114.1 hypothetical protein [Bifidobacterium simiiventris]